MTQFADQPARHLPGAVVYRDHQGDLTLSLDGGHTSFYVTVDGQPSGYSAKHAVALLSDEREIWRTGPEA